MFIKEAKTIEIKQDVPIKIVNSCGTDKLGHWYCLTCDETLTTNFDASSHEYEHKDHKIVWNCWDHGFETCAPYDPDLGPLV